jgi:hypothetical protein
LSAKRFTVSLEELVVVSSKLWSTSYAGEVPSVELSCETGVLGLSEVLGQDHVSESLAVDDDEGLAVRKPGDGISVGWFGKNLHQSLGEDLGVFIDLLIIREVTVVLLEVSVVHKLSVDHDFDVYRKRRREL